MKDGKTLEQNISRLKEIQDILSDPKVSLTNSLPLLREAGKIKKLVEEELKIVENELKNLEEENEI